MHLGGSSPWDTNPRADELVRSLGRLLGAAVVLGSCHCLASVSDSVWGGSGARTTAGRPREAEVGRPGGHASPERVTAILRVSTSGKPAGCLSNHHGASACVPRNSEVLETTVQKTKNGEVRYLQLAHNGWDAAARRSVPKVVYSFGREDQLDTDAIRRLVTALSRLLSPADALAATAGGDLVFTGSRPCGGSYVLDQLWTRLGIGKILTSLASAGRGRPRDAAAAERVLFGLVANRRSSRRPSWQRRSG